MPGAIKETKFSTLVEASPLLIEMSSAKASAALIDHVSRDYELLASPALLDIPADYAAKVAEIGDEDPMYIVMAMPSGPSRYLDVESVGNEDDPKEPHRFYPEEVMKQFAADIRANRPPGFAGHETWLSDGSLPENVPVHWVTAAESRRRKDGRYVTLARGYVTRQGNFREQIKLGIIDSASINAVGKVEMRKWTGTLESGDADNSNAEEHYVQWVTEARLLSFDLVKQNMHGVPGTKLVANIKERQGMDWKDLTPEQQKFVTEMTEAIVKEGNPALFQKLSAAQASNSNTANNTLVDDLTERCTRLQREKVDLAATSAVAEKTAKVLGVEINDLVERATELATVSADMVAERVKTLCASVKNAHWQKLLTAYFTENKPKTVADAEKMFNQKVAEYRAVVGGSAESLGLGETASTDRSNFNETGGLTPNWLEEAERRRREGMA